MGRRDLASRHAAALPMLPEQHVPHADVEAFGSRVGGGAHERSDLDLVLRNAQNPNVPVAGWTDLVEALQAGALPMLAEAHDWSRLPADFRDVSVRRHVVVQAGHLHEPAAVP